MQVGRPVEYSRRLGQAREDDYWYAAMLHELCKPSPDETSLASMMENLQRALDGLETVRLDGMRAIVGRDQGSFDDAFQALLAHRSEEIAIDKARGILGDAAVIAERQVFIEGLAILRLASRRGLTSDEEYLYCPSLARVPMNI